MVERVEPELFGHDQIIYMDQIEMELANIRSALQLSIEEAGAGSGGAAKPDGEQSLRLASSLWYFWFVRGY